jgi:hypothetical protein
MYLGTGDAVPADLTSRAAAAPSTRGGQPISVLRDVQVPHRGGMTLAADRQSDRGLAHSYARGDRRENRAPVPTRGGRSVSGIRRSDP